MFHKYLLFSFVFLTMFFMFIAFECFYSVGVQDLMLKAI